MRQRQRQLQGKKDFASQRPLVQLEREEGHCATDFSVGSPQRIELQRRLWAMVIISEVALVHAHVSLKLLRAASGITATVVAAAAAATREQDGVTDRGHGDPQTDPPMADAAATPVVGATALNWALYDTL